MCVSMSSLDIGDGLGGDLSRDAWLVLGTMTRPLTLCPSSSLHVHILLRPFAITIDQKFQFDSLPLHIGHLVFNPPPSPVLDMEMNLLEMSSLATST